jgi:hypothetical protein
VTERVPSCNPGYHEVLGCQGKGISCTCGGANPLGALNAVGVCEPDCETRKAQLEAELAKANAELTSYKQRYGQPVSGGSTTPPPPQLKQIQQPQIQQPLIKQAPRQLLR